MKIDINNLLENSFYITINNRKAVVIDEFFKQNNMLPIPHRFYGFKNPDIKSGPYKCMMSHAALIKLAKSLNLPFICIFEDDAYPCNNIYDKLKLFLSDIPNDAKLLILGWSKLFKQQIKYNDYINNLTGDNYGSHAYIIFNNGYDDFLKTYDKNPLIPADIFLNNFTNTGKYILNECLFIQYTYEMSMSIGKGYFYQDHPGVPYPPPGFPNIEKYKTRNLYYGIENKLDECLFNVGNFVYRPNGGNCGDMAIALSEFQLFEKLKLKYKLITRSNKYNIISHKYNLVYGGGGAWTIKQNYRPIMNTFINNKNLNKCLIMPSTFFECNDLIKLFDERFIVFCRDIQSYNYCKSINNKASFFLHDDSALFIQLNKLNTDLKYEDIQHPIIKRAFSQFINILNSSKVSNIGNFIRTDCEKTNINIYEGVKVDISDLLYFNGDDINQAIANRSTELMIFCIQQFEKIITNRLHVAIISSLLNKETFIYDNNYGKVNSVDEYSLKKFINSHFIECK